MSCYKILKSCVGQPKQHAKYRMSLSAMHTHNAIHMSVIRIYQEGRKLIGPMNMKHSRLEVTLLIFRNGLLRTGGSVYHVHRHSFP